MTPPPCPTDILSPPAFPSLPETSGHQPQQQQQQQLRLVGRLGCCRGAGLHRVLPFLPPLSGLPNSSSLFCLVGSKSYYLHPSPAKGPLEVSSKFEASYFWNPPQISRGYWLCNTTSTFGRSPPLKPNTEWERPREQGEGASREQSRVR